MGGFINLKFGKMKTKILLKGAMAAIVLFIGVALMAGTSRVSCEGYVFDQTGEPIAGISVTTTSGPNVTAATNIDGHYSMSGIQSGAAVRVIIPEGFSALGRTESGALTEVENFEDFSLFDESY